MLIQLIYASRSSRVLGPADVKDILGASQRNNTRAGITGALCLHNGIFLQLLEGDRAAVNVLYHRLLKDSRHRETAVLDLSERFDGVRPDPLRVPPERLRQAFIALDGDEAGRALLEPLNFKGLVTATDSEWDSIRALRLKQPVGSTAVRQ